MRTLKVIPRSPFERNLQVKRNFLRRELDLRRRTADAHVITTPDIVVEIGSGLVNINQRDTETIMKNSEK